MDKDDRVESMGVGLELGLFDLLLLERFFVNLFEVEVGLAVSSTTHSKQRHH